MPRATNFPWPELSEGQDLIAEEASEEAIPYVDETQRDLTMVVSEATMFASALAVDKATKHLESVLAGLLARDVITQAVAAQVLESYRGR